MVDTSFCHDREAPWQPPVLPGLINLAIKVDVDTQVGTMEGVPRLRDLFRARGIKASFYLSLGPDNSGRALWRVFTRPGFLTKMLRTRAPSSYGLKTLFMGTLLPAPIICQGQEGLCRELIADGHELGLHAWDHVTWHDRLWRMTGDKVRRELDLGLEAFSKLTGRPSQGFAAPAWRINVPALAALKRAGLVYVSGTRGNGPCWPVLYGHVFRLLEIPTTLPTADEALGRDGVSATNISNFFLDRILKPGLHVLTVHAEMEGRGLAQAFEKILDVCQECNVSFLRLIDVARAALAQPEEIPAVNVARMLIPGRPGRVSHQLP